VGFHGTCEKEGGEGNDPIEGVKNSREGYRFGMMTKTPAQGFVQKGDSDGGGRPTVRQKRLGGTQLVRDSGFVFQSPPYFEECGGKRTAMKPV